MNTLEKQMIQTLIDLRENYFVKGVKAEFEAECTQLDEAKKLKEIISVAKLDLTIKIGGCEAVKDIYDAKSLGAKTIVAPMIESPYALKKFIKATNTVFSEKERENIRFFINIETINGFRCLDEILESPFCGELAGIVFGRTDMCGSLDLTCKNVDDDEILEYAKIIAEKTVKYGKELIIGGSVKISSLDFFKKLSENCLSKYETRKIIFDAKKALIESNSTVGISKAIEFELLWLKYKQENFGGLNPVDCKRIELLNARQAK